MHAVLFLALRFQLCVLPKGGQGFWYGCCSSPITSCCAPVGRGVGVMNYILHQLCAQTEEKDELYMHVRVCACVLLTLWTPPPFSDVQSGVPFC